MKKYSVLLIAFFILCTTLNLGAQDQTFSDFATKILKTNYKPTQVVSTTKIVVVHPMVKDKVTEFVQTSSLSWEGDKCVKTVESFEQLQGKPVKGEGGVGKSFDFISIPKNLNEFCSNKEVSDWREDKGGLKLDKQNYSGYRFKAEVDNEVRDCSFFLNEDGSLKALLIDRPGKDSSNLKNFSESATVWYFSKIEGQVGLEKIVKVFTEKKNGIPFVKTITTEYN